MYCGRISLDLECLSLGDWVLKLYLCSPRGFCAGVVRAIDVVMLCLERFGSPIYLKHEIVHNPYVVKSLEAKGAITVGEVADIPRGSTVIFSAHGSPPEDFRTAAERDLQVIDATCPLVTKVHHEAHKYARDGRRLVLVGHHGHQEVVGTMGQESMHLIDDRGNEVLPDWEPDTPVTVLTQTTLSVRDTERSTEIVKARFKDVIVRNDICYATTNRQDAVEKLCRLVDLVLVIGASNSSNCNRLRELAEANGVESRLINGPKNLNTKWLDQVDNVGITSGASTPEELVNSVIKAIKPDEIEVVRGASEDITFVLPKELR